MCGFVGFADTDNAGFGLYDRQAVIKNMNAKIIHRGPDSDGFFVDDVVAIGFRRLSIIGLDDGDQPIYNENKTLVLVFNGEIYNYKELKEELKQRGHVFCTSSDSEVAIHGYEEYGADVLPQLRGMFSFIIWDAQKRELFGARDYFGIKPFYYYRGDNVFMFGSEIKSFLPHPKFVKTLNKDALKIYLTFQYSALCETFFKNVFKLEPASYFLYKDNTLTVNNYFEKLYQPEKGSFRSYAAELERTLMESVSYHQISDVEVGSFLSGGVDSSLIASCAKPDKTFSVGFANEGFDESILAKDLSDILHITNERKIISGDEFFDILPTVQYYSDEPNANLSAVPLYYLAQLAAKKVKVVLSGEGSDELFAGYISFIKSKPQKLYKALPFALRKAMLRFLKDSPDFKGKSIINKEGKRIEDYYIGQAFIMDDDEANDLLANEYKSSLSYKSVTAPFYVRVKDKDDSTKMLYLDMHLWLPNDILLKADKMTMAHSLELRVPFLDKEVWKLSAKIANKHKIKGKHTKYIFREVAKSKIPPEWAKRKKDRIPRAVQSMAARGKILRACEKCVVRRLYCYVF